MNEIRVIDEREVLGKQFKIYGDFEAPLFLAKDVAERLELTNVSDMISRVDTNEVTKLNLGGLQGECNFLTEDGLYEVLMQSRKPIAKAFKKEVKEILKSIRKHGAYMTDNTLEEALTSPDFLIRLATELKNEKEARKKAEDKIAEDKPKVLFAEAVNASSTSILIGDLAKILKQNGYDTGQKRLFEILRNKGFLMKTGSSKNMPTQKAMEMGLFEVKETTINNPDGSIRVTKTTKVTGAGQQFFINMFLAKAS